MAETSGLTFSQPAEAEEESGGGRREMDAELRIMGQMVRLLERLPVGARCNKRL